jgi:BirA family biotin operon repressor/biotin-[acetyl-CoA-carboxylase] ligase
LILDLAWVVLDEVASTQEVAADLLKGSTKVPGVIFAHHQAQGRGRFGRTWESARGDSLTMSLILSHYADWPQPWLIGMSVAVAAATCLGCQVRWPNDLALDGRKLGGILTEIVPGANGARVPVVGIGVNLNQAAFPEDLSHATSIFMQTSIRKDAQEVAVRILQELEKMPEPSTWGAIEPRWRMLDATPTKEYRLHDGSVVTALGVSETGSLLALKDDERIEVLAAEALFGV